jgi:large subunit ribosomal protein L31
MFKAEGGLMKKDIHPKTNDITVTCISCGNTFESESILKEIRVDTCNQCHPFYTGKDRSTKIDGRVDRFNKRYGNLKK